MTDYLSNKIRILQALLILMVLYIHTYYTEAGANMQILQNILGGGFCSVAVPLFYLISGYLFFLKIPDGISSIWDKLKKRCRTLLFPYLIANTLTFIFYILLNALIWKVPSLGGVVNFKIFSVIADKKIGEVLRFIFIDPPIAFQLWFVRDLMVVMLFSPLIYVIFKYVITKRLYVKIAFGILLLLFVFGHHVMFMPAAIWFTSGGLLSMAKINIDGRCNKTATLILSVFFAIMSVGTGIGFIGPEWKRYIPLVGIPAVWTLFDTIADKKQINQKVAYFSKYTFFVYLCHEPLLNIFKKMPLLISRSDAIMLIAYLAVPIVFYLIACCLASWLQKHAPKLYSIYTGGR